MGLRVVVVDDNPHVRWRGRVYPVNATFHRFLAAFLDLDGAPVSSIVHAVPLRELANDAPEPLTLPLDPRLEVVATAPFDGIAGYLRSAPAMLRANRPPLRAAIRDADLAWIKVPGSNAPLAAALAARARVPRFVWVAGSARDVAAARYGGAARIAGVAVGAAYDAIGRLAGVGGARVVVGRGIATDRGIVTSLVEPDEIRDRGRKAAAGSRLTLAWAGRVVAGKGLEDLLDGIAAIGPATRPRLLMIGDGPARPALEARAASLGIGVDIEWRGYVADRGHYLDALASADAFVFPSAAEGFPKVILDAMAVGLPVIAVAAGAVAELVRAGLVAELDPRDPGPAVSMVHSAADAHRLTNAGIAFAREHTRSAEAGRVVATWRDRWPELFD